MMTMTLVVLLLLGLNQGNAMEEFWTWEPIKPMDLSTVEPPHRDGNVKMYICRAKKDDEYAIGSYQDPPVDDKPQCATLDSNDNTFYEDNLDNIEIMKFPPEKVKWMTVKATDGRKDEIENNKDKLIQVGKEEEPVYICRSSGVFGHMRFGRVLPSTHSYGCGCADTGVFTGMATAWKYEVMAVK